MALMAHNNCIIEMTYAGLSSPAFQAVAHVAALQLLVQELTESIQLPPVVLRPVSKAEKASVSVKKLGSKADDAEVLCTAQNIELAEDQLRKEVKKYSVIEVPCSKDEFGLMAEVTALLKAHCAKVVRAEITNDKHIYKCCSQRTGRQMPAANLARLEEDIKMLREAGFAVKEVLKDSADSGDYTPKSPLGQRSPGKRGFTGIPRFMSTPTFTSTPKFPSTPSASFFGCKKEQIAVDTRANELLVCANISVGNTNGQRVDPWAQALEMEFLRKRVREIAELSTLPNVAIRHRPPPCFPYEVLSRAGASNCEWQHICGGSNVEEAARAFADRFCQYSTVTFSTDQDRPGLLADVTELLRLYDAHIIHAEVNVNSSDDYVIHIYKVCDVKTRRRLSPDVLARLESDFVVLRDAAPAVRQALSGK